MVHFSLTSPPSPSPSLPYTLAKSPWLVKFISNSFRVNFFCIRLHVRFSREKKTYENNKIKPYENVILCEVYRENLGGFTDCITWIFWGDKYVNFTCGDFASVASLAECLLDLWVFEFLSLWVFEFTHSNRYSTPVRGCLPYFLF